MGVYHLMGLGRSVGVITGPLSYLAHRYQRWNTEDQMFFSRSGEVRQRQEGKKVGDVQALILFTTPEVLSGELSCYGYVDNKKGYTRGPEEKGSMAKDVLGRLLEREWSAISGGRKVGDVFWCEINLRDIRVTYERIIQVVVALGSVGGQGHEMWCNLTGGNNILNFALELAATLSGKIARLYYVQAEDQNAEKCACFTAENGYWVDLPVMPLGLGPLTLEILEMLSDHNSMNCEDLYSRAYNGNYWNLMQEIRSPKVFMENYLTPMWKQGLITESDTGYVIGPQWELIKPYQEFLQTEQQISRSLEDLAQEQSWITQAEISLT